MAASRRLAGHAVRIVVGCLALLAAALWLAGTEPALRWGARQAERLSGNRLTLGPVHGSLYGPLRIEALRFRTEQRRIEVRQANLDWNPIALLGRHLHIDRLALDELRITELTPAAEPVALPQSLHLPLTLSAPAITLGRLVVSGGDSEQVLSGIDLGLERLADRYLLTLRSAASAWGSGQAELALDDTRPFKLSGHAGLQGTSARPYTAEIDASGSLEQLVLSARAKVLGGDVEINAGLRPFAGSPLGEARIEAGKLKPELLGENLPKAELGASAVVASDAAGNLRGSFSLRNALPGPWDQSRLPLREMSASFAGTPSRIDLREVHVDLAGAGRFAGDGQISDKRLQLDLATTAFNPQQIQAKLHPMQLAGRVVVHADAGSQRLTADLRDRRFHFRIDAGHDAGLLQLREATVAAGSGRLSVHGSLALGGVQAFELAGTLQGFNPADFGDYPAARVNGSLSAAGRLAGEAQATLALSLADSRFRQQPLTGQARLSVSARRIWNSDVALNLAGNRLIVKGALGSPGDRLDFQLDAAKLAMLDPQLGGQAQATGSLEGRFADPSGTIDARLSDLAWGRHYRIASLNAKARLDKGSDGPLALDAGLRGLATPQLALDRAELRAAGTRIRHVLQLSAKGSAIDLESRLVGGWRDKTGWSGQVTNLVNRGSRAFSLKAPAGLEAARQRFRLSQASFDVQGADLVVQELAYAAGQFSSRGEFRNLALAKLVRSADLETDLTLGGDWQVSIRDAINGHLALRRERGDIAVSTRPRIALGLDRLALHMTAADSRLQGRLDASGAGLGRLTADARSVLSVRDGRWGIAGNAPVQASAELSVKSLAWIQALIDSRGTLSLDGALAAQVNAAGTFAQPRLTGTVSGDRITLALPEQGLQFNDGRFAAELQGAALRIKSLTARGGDGSLSGEGRLAFDGGSPAMQVALKADRLLLLSRPDRLLVLSGTGDVSVTGRELRAVARLKADRGLIELSAADAPTASDDIVVLGRPAAAEDQRPPYAVGFDVDADLGEQFFVKGKGLDAQLGGALKLTRQGSAPLAARGSLRVVKGGYSAYGQRLAIERGILSFQGPLDNPGIDILALRKNQPVEAGVAVTGTAQAPSVRLVSSPTVPDSEKLSWLVLGHGLEDSRANEFDALQAAAGALLATGESVTLQQRIAHAAGLEEVSLRGASGLERAVLTLGKRLSSRAYLSYEQGLGGTESLVKINYALTRRLSIRAQTGSASAVDLFYSFSFD